MINISGTIKKSFLSHFQLKADCVQNLKQ